MSDPAWIARLDRFFYKWSWMMAFGNLSSHFESVYFGLAKKASCPTVSIAFRRFM